MLSIRVERNGDEAVLSLAGELDMATAPELRQAIVGVVADGANRIVLDLGEVTFCDSLGLGIIVGGLKRARSHGGDLGLRSVPDRLADTLALTGLDRVFAIEPPVATA